MMVLRIYSSKFELEPKDEPGNDYPNNAYYGDWNNSRGFQYFKFNKKSKKFEIIDLGVIDKIEAGNTNCNVKLLIIFLIFMI